MGAGASGAGVSGLSGSLSEAIGARLQRCFGRWAAIFRFVALCGHGAAFYHVGHLALLEIGVEHFVNPAGSRPHPMADGSPQPGSRRKTPARHADLAALAGVGIAVVALLFGALEYQVKVVGAAIKAEVAPLAIAIGDTDRRLGTQIQAVDKQITLRFDGMAQRMERFELRLDGLGDRMGKVEQRLEGLDQRVGQVERRLDGLDQRVGSLASQTAELNTHVGRLEGRLGM